MDKCQLCGVQFKVGDVINEVRKVTRLYPESIGTDRLHPVHDAWQHADQRVCVGNIQFQKNLDWAERQKVARE